MLNPELSSLVITQDGLQNIQALLQELQSNINAKSILLIEKSGQQLAGVGDITPHMMALSALLVGAFAATREIAQLIGEPEFKTMFQQGDKAHLFIQLLDTQDLLTIIFDEQTTHGIVKLKAKQFAGPISLEIQKMANQSANKKPLMNMN